MSERGGERPGGPAALFIRFKHWRQPKCPAIRACLHKAWDVGTLESGIAINNDKNVDYALKCAIDIIMSSKNFENQITLAYHYRDANMFRNYTDKIWKEISSNVNSL